MKNGELENGTNVYLDILKTMGLNAEIIPNDILAQSYSNIENEEEFLQKVDFKQELGKHKTEQKDTKQKLFEKI